MDKTKIFQQIQAVLLDLSIPVPGKINILLDQKFIRQYVYQAYDELLSKQSFVINDDKSIASHITSLNKNYAEINRLWGVFRDNGNRYWVEFTLNQQQEVIKIINKMLVYFYPDKKEDDDMIRHIVSIFLNEFTKKKDTVLVIDDKNQNLLFKDGEFRALKSL